MPASKESLPSTLEKSDPKIQRAFRETLDNALEEYHDEQRAHRVAWASVKNIATKDGDNWVLKAKYK